MSSKLFPVGSGSGGPESSTAKPSLPKQEKTATTVLREQPVISPAPYTRLTPLLQATQRASSVQIFFASGSGTSLEAKSGLGSPPGHHALAFSVLPHRDKETNSFFIYVQNLLICKHCTYYKIHLSFIIQRLIIQINASMIKIAVVVA